MGVRAGRGGEYNGEEEWGEGIMGWGGLHVYL